MPENEPVATKMSLKEAIDFRMDILRQTKSAGELFETAGQLALNIMSSQFVTGMPEQMSHFTDASSPKKLQSVLYLHDFQGVPEESDASQDEYQILLEASSLKERITRQLVRETITGKNKLHLNPTQQKYLLWGTQIADAHDQLFIKWRDEVTNGATFKELKRLQGQVEKTNPQAATDFAWKTYVAPTLDGPGDFLYTMPRIVTKDGPDKNKIVCIPYVQAFPQEIATIAHLIDDMIEDLQPQADVGDLDARGLISTHKAYKALLTYPPAGHTFIASEQEQLARELDKAWITEAKATDRKNSVQVFYSMEAYQDVMKKLVEPDYTIAFKDNRYKKINKKAEFAKKKMIRYFRTSKAFGQFQTLQTSLPVMQESSAVAYAMLLSGGRLGFRPAASNVPNRPEIRQKYGTKIDMDMVTYQERWKISQNFLSRLFTQKQIQRQFSSPEKLHTMLAGVFVPLHEVGHNAFVVEDTITRITSDVYSNLEEAKSDLIGIVGGLSFLKGKDRSLFVRSIFAEQLRGMSRRGESTDRTHLYGNILALNMMIETGLVKEKDGQWEFDDNEKNISSFASLAQERLLQVAHIYEQKSPEAGNAFIDEYFQEIPSLINLEEQAGIISPPTSE